MGFYGFDDNTYIKCIDGKWYAFAGNEERWQVYSIGSDCPPPESGCRLYCAKGTDSGIKSVASPSASRSAAYQKARRHGKYSGEW